MDWFSWMTAVLVVAGSLMALYFRFGIYCLDRVTQIDKKADPLFDEWRVIIERLKVGEVSLEEAYDAIDDVTERINEVYTQSNSWLRRYYGPSSRALHRMIPKCDRMVD